MKYLHFIAWFLFIGLMGLIVSAFIIISRDQKEFKNKTRYLNHQIELQRELIEDPPIKEEKPPEKGKG